MMATFLRKPHRVEAHHFDGTDEAARLIASAFPYRVARSVDGRDLLVLAGAVGRLIRVLEGTWVVEVAETRALELFPDEEFERKHRVEAT